MKIPHKVRRYCPHCRKHTEHSFDEVKKKKASELKQGQRRFRRVTAGYRGFPRPKPHRKKTCQRRDMRYKCGECGKMLAKGFVRVKKFEYEK